MKKDSMNIMASPLLLRPALGLSCRLPSAPNLMRYDEESPDNDDVIPPIVNDRRMGDGAHVIRKGLLQKSGSLTSVDDDSEDEGTAVDRAMISSRWHSSRDPSRRRVRFMAMEREEEYEEEKESDDSFSDFDYDEEDDLAVTIYEIPVQDFCDELHWSRADLKRMQRRSARVAIDCTEVRQDLAESIHHLFDAPMKIENSFADERDALATLAGSGARGIEEYVSPVLPLHRQWARKNIITLQRKLRGEDPRKLQVMLRIRSIQVSQRARNFAIKLAKGDRIEADKIFFGDDDDEPERRISADSLALSVDSKGPSHQ